MREIYSHFEEISQKFGTKMPTDRFLSVIVGFNADFLGTNDFKVRKVNESNGCTPFLGSFDSTLVCDMLLLELQL